MNTSAEDKFFWEIDLLDKTHPSDALLNQVERALGFYVLTWKEAEKWHGESQDDFIEKRKRREALRALIAREGNSRAAAKELGLTPGAFRYRLLRRYSLPTAPQEAKRKAIRILRSEFGEEIKNPGQIKIKSLENLHDQLERTALWQAFLASFGSDEMVGRALGRNAEGLRKRRTAYGLKLEKIREQIRSKMTFPIEDLRTPTGELQIRSQELAEDIRKRGGVTVDHLARAFILFSEALRHLPSVLLSLPTQDTLDALLHLLKHSDEKHDTDIIESARPTVAAFLQYWRALSAREVKHLNWQEATLRRYQSHLKALATLLGTEKFPDKSEKKKTRPEARSETEKKLSFDKLEQRIREHEVRREWQKLLGLLMEQADLTPETLEKEILAKSGDVKRWLDGERPSDLMIQRMEILFRRQFHSIAETLTKGWRNVFFGRKISVKASEKRVKEKETETPGRRPILAVLKPYKGLVKNKTLPAAVTLLSRQPSVRQSGYNPIEVRAFLTTPRIMKSWRIHSPKRIDHSKLFRRNSRAEVRTAWKPDIRSRTTGEEEMENEAGSTPLMKDQNGVIGDQEKARDQRKDRFTHQAGLPLASSDPDKDDQSQDPRKDVKSEKRHDLRPSFLDRFTAIPRKSTVMATPIEKTNQGLSPAAPGTKTPTTNEVKMILAPSRKKSEMRSTLSLDNIGGYSKRPQDSVKSKEGRRAEVRVGQEAEPAVGKGRSERSGIRWAEIKRWIFGPSRESKRRIAWMKKALEAHPDPNLQGILIFGSTARGMAHRQSDVDYLLILGTNKPPSPSFYEEVEVQQQADFILGTGFETDINQHPYLIPLILNSGEANPHSYFEDVIQRYFLPREETFGSTVPLVTEYIILARNPQQAEVIKSLIESKKAELSGKTLKTRPEVRSAASGQSPIEQLYQPLDFKYFREIRKTFFRRTKNPSIFVPSAGADLASILLLTNATTAVLVDMMSFKDPLNSVPDEKIKEYFEEKKRQTWNSNSIFFDRQGNTKTFILEELKRIGADFDPARDIVQDPNHSHVFHLHFKWAYPGEEAKDREFIFVGDTPMSRVGKRDFETWVKWLPESKRSKFDGMILKATEFLRKKLKLEEQGTGLDPKEKLMRLALPHLKRNAYIVSDFMPYALVRRRMREMSTEALRDMEEAGAQFGYGPSMTEIPATRKGAFIYKKSIRRPEARGKQRHLLRKVAQAGFRELLLKEIVRRLRKNPKDPGIAFIWKEGSLHGPMIPWKELDYLNRLSVEMSQDHKYAQARVLLKRLMLYSQVLSNMKFPKDFSVLNGTWGAVVTHPRFYKPSTKAPLSLKILEAPEKQIEDTGILAEVLEPGLMELRAKSEKPVLPWEEPVPETTRVQKEDIVSFADDKDLEGLRFVNPMSEAGARLAALQKSLGEWMEHNKIRPLLNKEQTLALLKEQFAGNHPDSIDWRDFAASFEIQASGRFGFKIPVKGKNDKVDFRLREPGEAPFRIFFRRRFDSKLFYHFFEFLYPDTQGKNQTAVFRIPRDDQNAPLSLVSRVVERVWSENPDFEKGRHKALSLLEAQFLLPPPDDPVWKKFQEMTAVISDFPEKHQQGISFQLKDGRKINLPFRFPIGTPVALTWKSYPEKGYQLYSAVAVDRGGRLKWSSADPILQTVMLRPDRTSRLLEASPDGDKEKLGAFLEAHLGLNPAQEEKMKSMPERVVHTDSDGAIYFDRRKTSGPKAVFYTGVKNGWAIVSGKTDPKDGAFYYETVGLKADMEPSDNDAVHRFYRLKRKARGSVNLKKNVIKRVRSKLRLYPDWPRAVALIRKQISSKNPLEDGFEDFEIMVPTNQYGKFVLTWRDETGETKYAQFAAGVPPHRPVYLGRRLDPASPERYIFRTRDVKGRVPAAYHFIELDNEGRPVGTVFHRVEYEGPVWKRPEVRSEARASLIEIEARRIVGHLDPAKTDERARAVAEVGAKFDKDVLSKDGKNIWPRKLQPGDVIYITKPPESDWALGGEEDQSVPPVLVYVGPIQLEGEPPALEFQSLFKDGVRYHFGGRDLSDLVGKSRIVLLTGIEGVKEPGKTPVSGPRPEILEESRVPAVQGQPDPARPEVWSGFWDLASIRKVFSNEDLKKIQAFDGSTPRRIFFYSASGVVSELSPKWIAKEVLTLNTALSSLPRLKHEIAILNKIGRYAEERLNIQGLKTGDGIYAPRYFNPGVWQEALEGIVFPRLEGMDLDRQFRYFEKPFDSELPYLHLADEMVSAVGYLHEINIVHGDVKPGNFLMRKDGTIVLIDFGAAQDLENPNLEITVGITPPFASPERLRSDDGFRFPSKADDVYALGISLALMRASKDLSNQLLGKRTEGNITTEMLRFLLNDRPELVKKALIGNPLEQIILKAIDPHPKNRYPDAIEMAKAIRLKIEKISRQEGRESESPRPEVRRTGKVRIPMPRQVAPGPWLLWIDRNLKPGSMVHRDRRRLFTFIHSLLWEDKHEYAGRIQKKTNSRRLIGLPAKGVPDQQGLEEILQRLEAVWDENWNGPLAFWFSLASGSLHIPNYIGKERRLLVLPRRIQLDVLFWDLYLHTAHVREVLKHWPEKITRRNHHFIKDFIMALDPGTALRYLELFAEAWENPPARFSERVPRGWIGAELPDLTWGKLYHWAFASALDFKVFYNPQRRNRLKRDYGQKGIPDYRGEIMKRLKKKFDKWPRTRQKALRDAISKILETEWGKLGIYPPWTNANYHPFLPTDWDPVPFGEQTKVGLRALTLPAVFGQPPFDPARTWPRYKGRIRRDLKFFRVPAKPRRPEARPGPSAGLVHHYRLESIIRSHEQVPLWGEGAKSIDVSKDELYARRVNKIRLAIALLERQGHLHSDFELIRRAGDLRKSTQIVGLEMPTHLLFHDPRARRTRIFYADPHTGTIYISLAFIDSRDSSQLSDISGFAVNLDAGQQEIGTYRKITRETSDPIEIHRRMKAAEKDFKLAGRRIILGGDLQEHSLRVKILLNRDKQIQQSVLVPRMMALKKQVFDLFGALAKRSFTGQTPDKTEYAGLARLFGRLAHLQESLGLHEEAIESYHYQTDTLHDLQKVDTGMLPVNQQESIVLLLLLAGLQDEFLRELRSFLIGEGLPTKLLERDRADEPFEQNYRANTLARRKDQLFDRFRGILYAQLEAASGREDRKKIRRVITEFGKIFEEAEAKNFGHRGIIRPEVRSASNDADTSKHLRTGRSEVRPSVAEAYGHFYISMLEHYLRYTEPKTGEQVIDELLEPLSVSPRVKAVHRKALEALEERLETNRVLWERFQKDGGRELLWQVLRGFENTGEDSGRAIGQSEWLIQFLDQYPRDEIYYLLEHLVLGRKTKDIEGDLREVFDGARTGAQFWAPYPGLFILNLTPGFFSFLQKKGLIPDSAAAIFNSRINPERPTFIVTKDHAFLPHEVHHFIYKFLEESSLLLKPDEKSKADAVAFDWFRNEIIAYLADQREFHYISPKDLIYTDNPVLLKKARRMRDFLASIVEWGRLKGLPPRAFIYAAYRSRTFDEMKRRFVDLLPLGGPATSEELNTMWRVFRPPFSGLKDHDREAFQELVEDVSWLVQRKRFSAPEFVLFEFTRNAVNFHSDQVGDLTSKLDTLAPFLELFGVTREKYEAISGAILSERLPDLGSDEVLELLKWPRVWTQSIRLGHRVEPALLERARKRAPFLELLNLLNRNLWLIQGWHNPYGGEFYPYDDQNKLGFRDHQPDPRYLWNLREHGPKSFGEARQMVGEIIRDRMKLPGKPGEWGTKLDVMKARWLGDWERIQELAQELGISIFPEPHGKRPEVRASEKPDLEIIDLLGDTPVVHTSTIDTLIGGLALPQLVLFYVPLLNADKVLVLGGSVFDIETLLPLVPRATIINVDIESNQLEKLQARFHNDPDVAKRLKLYRADASRLDPQIFEDASFDFILGGGLTELAFEDQKLAEEILRKIAKEEIRLLKDGKYLYHLYKKPELYFGKTFDSRELVQVESYSGEKIHGLFFKDIRPEVRSGFSPEERRNEQDFFETFIDAFDHLDLSQFEDVVLLRSFQALLPKMAKEMPQVKDGLSGRIYKTASLVKRALQAEKDQDLFVELQALFSQRDSESGPVIAFPEIVRYFTELRNVYVFKDELDYTRMVIDGHLRKKLREEVNLSFRRFQSRQFDRHQTGFINLQELAVLGFSEVLKQRLAQIRARWDQYRVIKSDPVYYAGRIKTVDRLFGEIRRIEKYTGRRAEVRKEQSKAESVMFKGKKEIIADGAAVDSGRRDRRFPLQEADKSKKPSQLPWAAYSFFQSSLEQIIQAMKINANRIIPRMTLAFKEVFQIFSLTITAARDRLTALISPFASKSLLLGGNKVFISLQLTTGLNLSQILFSQSENTPRAEVRGRYPGDEPFKALLIKHEAKLGPIAEELKVSQATISNWVTAYGFEVLAQRLRTSRSAEMWREEGYGKIIEDLIQSAGAKKLSIKDIARQLGISHGLAKYHLRKRGLLKQVRREPTRKLSQEALRAHEYLTELITKPVDFDWRGNKNKIPNLTGLPLGVTSKQGWITLSPKNDFYYRLSMPHLREAGWEVIIEKAGVVENVYEFTVKLIKGKQVQRRTFQFGGREKILKKSKDRRKSLSVLEISDRLGLLFLENFVSDKKEFGWRLLTGNFPDLAGMRLGSTYNDGGIRPMPFPRYVFYWQILGFEEKGWDAVIEKSRTVGEIFEFDVKLSKGDRTIRKTFQISPYFTRDLVRLGEGKNKDAKKITVLDIDDRLGRKGIGELIQKPADFDWTAEAPHLPKLDGLGLGETGEHGEISIPVGKYYDYSWSVLGRQGKGWKAVIVKGVVKDGHYELVVRLTKKKRILVRTFQISRFTQQVPGVFKEKGKIKDVLEIGNRLGLKSISEWILRSWDTVLDEKREDPSWLKGLLLGVTWRDGKLRFSPMPYNTYEWPVLGSQEGGWPARIAEAWIENKRVRFKVELKKFGRTPIYRTFQIGPSRRRLTLHQNPPLGIERGTAFRLTHLDTVIGLVLQLESGSKAKIASFDKETRHAEFLDPFQGTFSRVIGGEIFEQLDRLLTLMSEREREIADRIIDGENDEAIVSKGKFSADEVKDVKTLLQAGLRKFQEKVDESSFNKKDKKTKGRAEVRERERIANSLERIAGRGNERKESSGRVSFDWKTVRLSKWRDRLPLRRQDHKTRRESNQEFSFLTFFGINNHPKTIITAINKAMRILGRELSLKKKSVVTIPEKTRVKILKQAVPNSFFRSSFIAGFAGTGVFIISYNLFEIYIFVNSFNWKYFRRAEVRGVREAIELLLPLIEESRMKNRTQAKIVLLQLLDRFENSKPIEKELAERVRRHVINQQDQFLKVVSRVERKPYRKAFNAVNRHLPMTPYEKEISDALEHILEKNQSILNALKAFASEFKGVRVIKLEDIQKRVGPKIEISLQDLEEVIDSFNHRVNRRFSLGIQFIPVEDQLPGTYRMIRRAEVRSSMSDVGAQFIAPSKGGINPAPTFMPSRTGSASATDGNDGRRGSEGRTALVLARKTGEFLARRAEPPGDFLGELIQFAKRGTDGWALFEKELHRAIETPVISEILRERMGARTAFAGEALPTMPAAWQKKFSGERIMQSVKIHEDRNFVIYAGSVPAEVIVNFVTDAFPRFGEGSRVAVVYESESDASEIRSELHKTPYWTRIRYYRVKRDLRTALSDAYQEFRREAAGAVVVAPSLEDMEAVPIHKRLQLGQELTEAAAPWLTEDVLAQAAALIAGIPVVIQPDELKREIARITAILSTRGFEGLRFENGFIPDIERYLQFIAAQSEAGSGVQVSA